DGLFAIVDGNRGVGVIAGLVGIGDLTQQFVALDDVQANVLFVRGENAENDVVSGNHGSQRERLVLGHLDESANLVREPAQFVKINHTLYSTQPTQKDSSSDMLTQT